MELIVRVLKSWSPKTSKPVVYAMSFIKTNENDPSDRVTFEDNPADMQRFAALGADIEKFVDDYPFFSSDGKSSNLESSE